MPLPLRVKEEQVLEDERIVPDGLVQAVDVPAAPVDPAVPAAAAPAVW